MHQRLLFIWAGQPGRISPSEEGHTLEFLREIAPLRPRTNTFGAVSASASLWHLLFINISMTMVSITYITHHHCITTAKEQELVQVTTLNLQDVPKNDDGPVDFTKDFFGKPTSLTVSGQLEGELRALALSNIYTFGPTFRAENSNTPRHLAEFWMIKPEIAFYDIQNNMDLAEDFLKYLVSYALEHCSEMICCSFRTCTTRN
jgi:asparaginyl-tRNA synthetase